MSRAFSYAGKFAGLILFPPLGAYTISKAMDYFSLVHHESTKLSVSTPRNSIGVPDHSTSFVLRRTSDGKELSEKHFLRETTHWTLLYFGFAQCVEVCPNSIRYICRLIKEIRNSEKQIVGNKRDAKESLENEASNAFQENGGSANEVRGAFVTLDPIRDGSQQVELFLNTHCDRSTREFFDGYAGNPTDTISVAQVWRVYFSSPEKDEQKSNPEYQIDHSNFIFLVSPSGKFVDFFAKDMPEEMVVEKIKMHMEGAYDIDVY